MNSIDHSQLDTIKNHLVEKISPYLIILFGSAAKGTMTHQSDIDIAFLSDQPVNDYEVFMVAQELSDLLNRQVDLINLANASTVFRAQVIGTGKTIYDNDPFRRMTFQMNSLKAYAKLNEERQCVLDKVRERGFMHGK